MGKRQKSFKPGQGYTKEDWDAVADNPEWTAEDFAKAKPFAEVFPELRSLYPQGPRLGQGAGKASYQQDQVKFGAIVFPRSSPRRRGPIHSDARGNI
jgi:hypothetical protein